MLIVNLQEFLKLPTGAVCAKYRPYYFENLFVKGESLGNDFYMEYLTDELDVESSEEFSDKLFLAEKEKMSIDMDFNTTMRDGCFEEGQLFAVWEKKDIKGLIDKLQESYENYHQPELSTRDSNTCDQGSEGNIK